MQIELKTITMMNFKKVQNQTLEFSHNTLISGGNATGKSTIYDAYLWCIFGVLSKQNSVVQPLDASNTIIHKLETSVTIVLNVNNERDVKIQRILSEKWKAKDSTEEQFVGTTQERFIDDLPLSAAAFKQKLSEVADYEKWFMLSNINLFWTKKADERRKVLMSLAGEINEEELMLPYPAVYKGVITEKKDVGEMLAQQKLLRKKADEELKLIPAKIQAQNLLKVNADFAALKEEKESIDAQITNIDAFLQGSTREDPAMKEYIAKVQALNLEIVKAQKRWQDEKMTLIDTILQNIANASDALNKAKDDAEKHHAAYIHSKIELSKISIDFDDKVKEWKDVNNKEFDYIQTSICPVCGRPYTEEMKAIEYHNAVAKFNQAKSEKLIELQTEASVLKRQMAVLKGNINTYEQITKEHDEVETACKQVDYDSFLTCRAEAQGRTWETSTEKHGYDEKLMALEDTKPHEKPSDISVNERKNQKTELIERRNKIERMLAAEQVNNRIEEEKIKLNYRSKELAQVIADCDEIIRQIKAYKKSKISTVENKVNSFFSLIHWKFYEQNISNDGEKEICTAIDKDGVDYGNANDGTVINMGVDIISGIAKATDLFVPLFVDRKESVEHIVPVKQQVISLQCVFGQPLKVEFV